MPDLNCPSFTLPPRAYNAEGKTRRVGFEFEYAGLPLSRSAEIVRNVFGGTIEHRHRFHFLVTGTRFGEFSIESDSSLLKDKRYEKHLQSLGLDPATSEIGQKLEEWIESVSNDFVPFEIVSPPLPMNDLECIEELRHELMQAGARGTHAHLFAAYGMQFNPEIPAFDVGTLVGYMRAFFLLFDRLRASSDVPIARRLLPYIDPFPESYVEKVLDLDYEPDLERFMRDYLKENPTRNRPLDWLPLFAYLNHDLVFEYPVEKHLIKPRPTLHYRLPSSLIDDPKWSIAAEWKKWIEIECLACDQDLQEAMVREWRQIHGPLQLRSESRWLKRSDEMISRS